MKTSLKDCSNTCSIWKARIMWGKTGIVGMANRYTAVATRGSKRQNNKQA